MRARLLPLPLLVACAGDADAPPDDAWDGLDLAACGATCGDGPKLLLDEVNLGEPVDGVLPGFDLDGLDEDCGVPDAEGGVDNRVGAMWPAFPAIITTAAPELLASTIRGGDLMLIFEVVGADALTDDGPVAVVVRKGDGDVMLGGGTSPLAGQTVGVDADPVLGAATTATAADGAVVTEPFELQLRFPLLNSVVDMPMIDARLRLVDDGEGGVHVELGGLLRVDDVSELALAASCTDVGALVPPVLDLITDARSTPDGPCDAVSVTLVGHAVPVFVHDDAAP